MASSVQVNVRTTPFIVDELDRIGLHTIKFNEGEIIRIC